MSVCFFFSGCGDYYIKNMTFLPDPCPTPTMEKRRSLNVKERVIYAPMSGVGGIVYDKDAVYIDIQDKQAAEEVIKRVDWGVSKFGYVN